MSAWACAMRSVMSRCSMAACTCAVAASRIVSICARVVRCTPRARVTVTATVIAARHQVPIAVHASHDNGPNPAAVACQSMEAALLSGMAITTPLSRAAPCRCGDVFEIPWFDTAGAPSYLGSGPGYHHRGQAGILLLKVAMTRSWRPRGIRARRLLLALAAVAVTHLALLGEVGGGGPRHSPAASPSRAAGARALVPVSTESPGRVVAVGASEGQHVRAGTVAAAARTRLAVSAWFGSPARAGGCAPAVPAAAEFCAIHAAWCARCVTALR